MIISITTNSTLNILKCLSPNSNEALSFYEGLVSIYYANCLLEAMPFLKNVKWIIVEICFSWAIKRTLCCRGIFFLILKSWHFQIRNERSVLIDSSIFSRIDVKNPAIKFIRYELFISVKEQFPCAKLMAQMPELKLLQFALFRTTIKPFYRVFLRRHIMKYFWVIPGIVYDSFVL